MENSKEAMFVYEDAAFRLVLSFEAYYVLRPRCKRTIMGTVVGVVTWH